MLREGLTTTVEKPAANPEILRAPTPTRSAEQGARHVQAPSFPVLQLQRTLGNRKVAHLIQTERLFRQGQSLSLDMPPAAAQANNHSQLTDHAHSEQNGRAASHPKAPKPGASAPRPERPASVAASSRKVPPSPRLASERTQAHVRGKGPRPQGAAQNLKATQVKAPVMSHTAGPRPVPAEKKPVHRSAAQVLTTEGGPGASRGPHQNPHDWSRSEIILPETHTPGGRALAHAVADHGKAMRRALSGPVATGAKEILSETAHQRALVNHVGHAQIAQVKGRFDAAHRQVEQIFSAAETTLETNAETCAASLEQWRVSATGQATDTVLVSARRATDFGNQYGDLAIRAADEEAGKASGEFKSRIADAQRIGEAHAAAGGSKPEIAHAKAKAARELAADTEQKVNDAVEKFLPDLRATGPDVAHSLQLEAVKASMLITGIAPGLANQIDDTHHQTAEAISRAVGQQSHSLSAAAGQVAAMLADSEVKATHKLQTQMAQVSRELEVAGQRAAAALDSSGHRAAHAGDQRLSQLSHQLGGLNIDEKQASAADGLVRTAIGNPYQTLTGQVNNASGAIQNHLAHAAEPAMQGMQATGAKISENLAALTKQTQSRVGEQTAAFSVQLTGAVTQLNSAGEGMLKNIGSSLDSELGELDKGFAKGVEDYRTGLQDQVTKGLDDVREPTDSLPDRIAAAQKKIEDQVDKSWLERQWDDFVSMVSDAGFWVGLLVGLVLVVVAIAFLPEELGLLAVAAVGAAIGAISAGAGTIVSNLTHNRPWHENLLRNMAIGAGGGAVFAVVAVGLSALGVGTLGIVGAMSLTAGVVTVVTNLITGKPWDEGLLANMAFAGLFAGAGKFLPKFGGRPTIEPDPNPVRPPTSEPPSPAPQPDPSQPVTPQPVSPQPVPPEPVPPEPVPPQPVPPNPVPPEPAPPGPKPPEPVPPQPAPPEPLPPTPVPLPKFWAKFAPQLNEAFRIRLQAFRGNNDLNTDFRGGEGRVFAAEGKSTALKRWFESRLGDMPKSIQLLEDARTAVKANPKLSDLEVVDIQEKGPDFIQRDFEIDSVELKDATSEPAAQEARARAIAELQGQKAAGKLPDVLNDVLGKLKREPPSANLHWSPKTHKITVIDMQ